LSFLSFGRSVVCDTQDMPVLERTEHLQTVHRLYGALQELEPQTEAFELVDRAEAIAVLSDEYDLTTDDVVRWFRTTEFRTVAAFLQWAIRKARAQTFVNAILCPNCTSELAEHIADGRYFCSGCALEVGRYS
jgi:hypothetical protein